MSKSVLQLLHSWFTTVFSVFTTRMHMVVIRKQIVLLVLVLSFLSGAGVGQIWVNPITTGKPISSHYLGDKLNSGSTWYFNFEIGQASWNSSQVGLGQNSDGVTGWDYSDAYWYEDGSGSNKRVRRNIAEFQFTATGTWYIVGRAKANSGDPYTYADDIGWTNETSFSTTNASYFQISSLAQPTDVGTDAPTGTTVNLSWTKWEGRNVMVVRNSSNSFTNPTNGTAYSVGNTIGSGTVVYNGSGTSGTATGLTPGTKYYFAFYSENYSYYSTYALDSAITGYQTTQNGNFSSSGTWDGGVVPSSGSSIIVKNQLTLDQDYTASAVTIEGTGNLVVDGERNLTIAADGLWTNNGTFTASTGTVILQTNVSTGGTSTTEFNNVTVLGVDVNFNNAVSAINGILNITTGSVRNAPQFREGSTLKYSQGGTYTRVTEWNNPWHVVVANNTSLDLNITAFGGDITVYGNLTVESGSAVDMKNYTNFLIINNNLNLDGTLVLSSQSGGDLKLKGNLNLNAGSTLSFNDRAVFLLGTSSQQITDDVGVTFPYLIVDNSAGVVSNDNLVVSKRLTLTSGVFDMQANILSIGTDAANLGEIETTSGFVKGILRRWFAASTNSTDATGIFPVSPGNHRRNVGIYFTVAPTTGGTIDAEFLDKPDIPVEIREDYNKGLPIANCDGVDVNNIYENGIWKLTTSGITDGTYTIKFNTHGIDKIETASNLRMVKKTNATDDWIYQGTASVTTINAGTYEHWVQQAGLTTFSFFALGGEFSENPLPIDLVSFEGRQTHDQITLTWQTASEYNNQYFSILRADESLQFTEIGSVPTQGNSSTMQQYTFAENDPVVSHSYYKLRQIDFDGHFTESKVIHVPFQVENIRLKKVSNTIVIDFPFTVDQQVDYQIVDIGGSIIQKGRLTVKQGQTVEIQLVSKIDDVFFVSLSGNFKPVTFKMYKN